MSALNKIFALKKNDSKVIDKPQEEDIQKEKLTFFESGYGSSKQAEGNYMVFKACLQDVYMDYKGKCRVDENLQNNLKIPYIEEKGKRETELKKRKTAKGLIEESIKDLEEKIIKFANEISEVKHNPEKYVEDVDKKPKAQFYLGLIVLIPITFYLLVFYMSASFSAFFKNFNTNELTSAIFDGKALSKAMEGGWLEGVFIATIPFAFMGLGYLVHMFLKHKNWISYLKIALLFAVTFIFDAILAYQIEKKIYDIERTPDSPLFNAEIAFSKVEFWGIIFAGFVVYIIWGLVFDFIMKEYDNFDKIKSFIRSRREDIKNCELNISKLINKLNPIKEEISGIEGKIDDLQRTIDGFIFSNKHYLTYHAEYVKGWFLAITDNFEGIKKRDELLSKCVEAELKHLENHSINDESYEGRLYKLINLMKKYTISLIVFCFIFSSCKNEKQHEIITEVQTEYKPLKLTSNRPNLNISILLDLSDRISPEKYPNPSMEFYLRDVGYIKSIAQSFEIHVRNKKSITINDKLQLFIDPEPNDKNINEKIKNLKVSFTKDNAKKALILQTSKNYDSVSKLIYESAINDNKYIGSDIWKFFRNKVKDYCIDKESRNILIILTDGYIYHSNTRRKELNLTTYLTPQYIRDHKLNNEKWNDRFVNNKFGFIPATTDLSNLEILVLGINPDKKNTYEEEVIRAYWGNWLTNMGVKKYDLKNADLPTNMEKVIRSFILEN